MTENLPERKPDKVAKTQYMFMGFSQTAGIRIYAFECIGDGRRTGYTVTVDLGLISGYGIQIQDLPLLCRDLLLERVDPDTISALTFTEQDMRWQADRRATAREEAEQRKKRPRPHVTPPVESNWRGPYR